MMENGDRFVSDEPFIDERKPSSTTAVKGVVHAYVDQKLLKSNKIKSLIDDQNTGSRHCSNRYKRIRITTLAYALMSVRPPNTI
jgi:hypothetical protein